MVTAELPAGTHLGMTLVLQHAVQAFRLEAAWTIVCRFAVALGDLGNVGGVDLDLAERFVDL